MYTVLIMPKKTEDNMQEHYPAIRDVVDNANIGICSWNVDGDTMETALPQLYELVDNTREWSAVIVLYDEDLLQDVNPVNPFDLVGDEKSTDSINWIERLHESNQNPLIRLTHFLNGIPIPSPEYDREDRWGYEPDERNPAEPPGEPYSLYEMHDREQHINDIEEYESWNKQYAMKGIAPAELMLVATRDKLFRRDYSEIRQVWEVHNESDNSYFWRRNLYPRRTRFLVYDIEKRGKMDEERDAFRFWMALMTLSVNSIGTNDLRPQMLYRFGIKLDKKKLSAVFQDSVNDLNRAYDKLKKSLEEKEEKEFSEDVPNYQLEVPVSFQRVKTSNAGSTSFSVHLTGGVTSGEEDEWESYTVDTYLKTAEMVKEVERELELSAMSFKARCRYKETEVQLLSPFAEEDLGYALHDTYNEVLKAQKELPPGIVNYRDEMKAADKKVKRDIKERMSGAQMSAVIGFATIVFLIVLLPAIRQESSQTEAIWIAAIAVLAILGGGLLRVFLQKLRFKRHVDSFKSYYTRMCADLDSSSVLYKAFIGRIASHIHGSSYRKIMNEKKLSADQAIGIRKTHIGFIEEFKGRLALWGSSLRLSVDYDAIDDTPQEDEVDEIDFYHLYSLSLGDYYKSIPLNDTGYPVQTPFNFAERLLIEREEVYDDI